MNIILNELTEDKVQYFIENPNLALALHAPTGSGKGYLANYIATQILSKSKISKYNITTLKPISNKHLIEDLRQLLNTIKIKSENQNVISKIYIIEDLDLMTQETQNLLLKPLEEMPKGILFILTFSSKQKVLTTIHSRINTIDVNTPDIQKIIQIYEPKFYKKDIEKASMIANGKIGLISAILSQEDHQIITKLDIAKQFLSADQFSKLNMVNEIAKEDIPEFLDALLIVADSGFSATVAKGTSGTTKWHNIRKATLHAKKLNLANCNSKLLLTNLIVDIV